MLSVVRIIFREIIFPLIRVRLMSGLSLSTEPVRRILGGGLGLAQYMLSMGTKSFAVLPRQK